MSRYGVDQVLRELTQCGAEERSRFQADRAAWLWARKRLTDEERQNLIAFDVGALYSRGAHPFLLWVSYSRISEGDRRPLYEAYLRAIAPHGRPELRRD